ncbi:hypothetical protein BDZ90DRAFT_85871 [Jaminaea rosea]|uniref:VanZ-like domain-containing protein n=1 Tax=Jaminaea rosea TaxID=1569628 RepID=A0A316UMV3_9BASI|nr:hypothetical protein BDZ90DRAFT_85871 [Jaminaea rosea]PWN25253.1 hypothetical protein BDZ90DRAFT_85871 [Jaminaea rosea]
MPPQLSSSGTNPSYTDEAKQLFLHPFTPPANTTRRALLRRLLVRSIPIRIASSSSSRSSPPITLPLSVRPALLLLNIVDLLLLGLLGFHPASSTVVPLNDKLLHFICFFLASLLFYSIWDVPSTTRRTSPFYRYLPLGLSFFVCFLVGGVGSEFVQALLPYKRFDWWDVVANLAGSSLGLWVSWWAERRYRLDREMRSEYRAVDVEEIYGDDAGSDAGSEGEGEEEEQQQQQQHGAGRQGGRGRHDPWSAHDDDIYSTQQGGRSNGSTMLFSIDDDDDDVEERAGKKTQSTSIPPDGQGQGEANVWSDDHGR